MLINHIVCRVRFQPVECKVVKPREGTARPPPKSTNPDFFAFSSTEHTNYLKPRGSRGLIEGRDWRVMLEAWSDFLYCLGGSSSRVNCVSSVLTEVKCEGCGILMSLFLAILITYIISVNLSFFICKLELTTHVFCEVL